MKKKGRLLQTRFIAVASNAPCFTCKYHDWDTQKKATQVRVQTYEHITIKTYFCDEHSVAAQRVTAA